MLKQNVGSQSLVAVPTVKFQSHEAEVGVELWKVTHNGAHPSAGDGLVVNVTIGNGFTTIVTVSVAGRVVQLSVTVTV